MTYPIPPVPPARPARYAVYIRPKKSIRFRLARGENPGPDANLAELYVYGATVADALGAALTVAHKHHLAGKVGILAWSYGGQPDLSIEADKLTAHL